MRLFRKTGYLVHAIAKVFKEMTHFLIVFFIVILQFAYSFLSLNIGHKFKGPDYTPVFPMDSVYGA